MATYIVTFEVLVEDAEDREDAEYQGREALGDGTPVDCVSVTEV